MRPSRSFRAAIATSVLVGGLIVAPSSALAANPEGQLDPSFSGDGLSSTPGFTTFHATTMQPDGKFLTAYGFKANPTVRRVTAGGDPDTTFGGGDGITTIALPDAVVFGMTVQPDGRIVVVGNSAVSSNGPGFVARLLPDGSTDTSFGGGDGIADVPLGTYTAMDLLDVAMDPAGRIVVAGGAYAGGLGDLLLARLTGTGALDTTFGGDGIVTQTYKGEAYAANVAVQADGKIVVLGTTFNTAGIWMGRRNTDGSPDASFLSGGAEIAVGPFAWPGDLAIDSEGRAVAAAVSSTTVWVWRHDASTGELDTSFGGGDGIYEATENVVNGDAPIAIAFEPNGKIVAATSVDTDALLFRLLPMGTLDPTFGTDGRTVTTGTADTIWFTKSLHIDGRGRIFALGRPPAAGALAISAYVGDATKPFGARVFPGATFATSSRSIRWTATDDNTGIKNYDVRYRSAAYSSSALGSTVTAWKTNTVATSASFAGSAGRTYCFDARADDNAGNVSNSSPAACVAFPLDDRSLTRAGSWTSVSQSSSYKGTLSRSSSSGATLKKTGVKYRKLAVVATTCSSCGKVSVYLGSTKLATLDLKSSTTKRKVVFLVDTSATVKSGTVTIKQVSGGKPVFIDGLGVSLY